MKLKIRFKHIDVAALVRSDGENGGALISRIKTAAVKGAVKYTPFAVESAIQKKLEDIINRYDAGITLETVALIKKSDGEIAGIAAAIEDIDYYSLFLAIKPFIMRSVRSSAAASRIADVIGDDDNALIESIDSSLSDDKKAKIAELLTEEYNKELCGLINKYAKQNGLDLTADKIVFRA